MKRLFAMLLCSALLLGTFGCAAETAPTPSQPAGGPERVDLKWYVNFSWYNTPWGGNAVSEAISEKTGVDITFVSPAGSETETLPSGEAKVMSTPVLAVTASLTALPPQGVLYQL